MPAFRALVHLLLALALVLPGLARADMASGAAAADAVEMADTCHDLMDADPSPPPPQDDCCDGGACHCPCAQTVASAMPLIPRAEPAWGVATPGAPYRRDARPLAPRAPEIRPPIA